MDTMKLLLGATVALLLGALAVSWQGMNQGVRNAPADEVARLRKQVEELQAEQDKLQLEKELQRVKASTPVTPTASTNAAEIEAMKAELAAGKQRLAEIEAEKAKRDNKLEEMEQGEMAQRDLESGDKELRRARLIADALLIGKVKEYVVDAEYGGFITFDVLMPEQVQIGTILGIRRKTGLLCQYKVSDVTPEGGIANPLPGFGNVQPNVGDELILPPPY